MTVPADTPTSRGRVLGVSVIAAGVLLALWVSGSRALFGMAGTVAVIMACTIAPVGLVLHVFAGMWLRRAGALGHRFAPAVVALAMSWTSGILFGLTVPEITADGPRSLLAPTGDAFSMEMSIALCNPLAVVYLGTTIASAVFARLARRGPRVELEEDLAS